MTPQKANNNIIEDLMQSERDDFPGAELRRMIRKFNEHKENIQKQFKEYQENMDKKLKKTQKQLNEVREDFNKLQNETKETIKKTGM
jgi:DNA anti-recombination protein RmuC